MLHVNSLKQIHFSDTISSCWDIKQPAHKNDTVQSSDDVFGHVQAPVPPAKPHKGRQERVDDLLENLRNRNTVDEETLTSVLNDKQHFGKKFPDAQYLLAQVQRGVDLSLFTWIIYWFM